MSGSNDKEIPDLLAHIPDSRSLDTKVLESRPVKTESPTSSLDKPSVTPSSTKVSSDSPGNPGREQVTISEESPPPPPRLLAGIFGLPDTLKTLSNLGVAKCKLNPAQGILMGWQSMAYLGFAALFAFIIMTARSEERRVGKETLPYVGCVSRYCIGSSNHIWSQFSHRRLYDFSHIINV